MSAELLVQHPGGGVTRIAVPDGGIVLGREPDPRRGDVHRIDNKAASREHCRVRRDGGGWVVEDLDSANGTYVNDAEVTGPTPLAAGDVLRLGRGALVVLTAAFQVGPAAPVPVDQRVVQVEQRVAEVEAERDEAAGALDVARQALASTRAECEELRAQLRAAETVRLAAEERERQARLREREARVESDESVGALVQARHQLAEAVAVRADLTNELAAAREKLVRHEAGESEALRALRSQLDDRQQRCQKLERELGQRNTRVGEFEVALQTADGNRDRALALQSATQRRLDELEQIVQKQSDLLRDLQRG